MGIKNKIVRFKTAIAIFGLAVLIGFSACEKKSGIEGPPFDINNSLTLFKPDNVAADLASTDTVPSQSGLNAKFIPVSGSAGAVAGLESIQIDLLLASNDSLVNSKVITKFSRPDYHVLNSEPIDIPKAVRGKIYTVVITVKDKAGAEIGKKTFKGIDVLTCDPQPNCIVAGQITLLVEAPATTLPTDEIFVWGGFNGWANTDQTYKLTLNPDVPNCYCISLPFEPGVPNWMIGEIYVTRGSWGTNAVSADGTETYIANYNAGDMGPLFKMKVPRWRDR